jgi:hypothetical protein
MSFFEGRMFWRWIVTNITAARGTLHCRKKESVIDLSERWSEKDLEGSGRGLILRYYIGIYQEEIRKSSKYLRISGL